jgi:hypothetical protein
MSWYKESQSQSFLDKVQVLSYGTDRLVISILGRRYQYNVDGSGYGPRIDALKKRNNKHKAGQELSRLIQNLSPYLVTNKVAMPLLDVKPKETDYPLYMDIGHINAYQDEGQDYQYNARRDDYLSRNVEYSIMWVIDKHWKFHQKESTNDTNIHEVEFEDELDDCIASGRYEVSEREPQGVCSLFLGQRADRIRGNPKLVERITRVLDEEFNNPKIINYT